MISLQLIKKCGFLLALFMTINTLALAASGTTTSNFTVTAYYSSSCANGLAVFEIPIFEYDYSEILSSQVGYFVGCVAGEYKISASTDSVGSDGLRQMKEMGGSDVLKYNIFTDPGYSSVWGGGANSKFESIIQAEVGKPKAFNFYIKINADQNSSAGSYADKITLTLSPNF